MIPSYDRYQRCQGELDIHKCENQQCSNVWAGKPQGSMSFDIGTAGRRVFFCNDKCLAEHEATCDDPLMPYSHVLAELHG